MTLAEDRQHAFGNTVAPTAQSQGRASNIIAVKNIAGKNSAPKNLQPPPEQLLKRLEWKVVRRLDGFLFGDYSGVFYGPSLDLAEVREYQPGDEVRRIDWNVTARAGKLHTRQYREEREITVWLIVDCAASMLFGTRRLLKQDLALEFAGTAASVAARHGDKVGAIAISQNGLKVLPPRPGKAQTLSILSALQNASSQGPSNLTSGLAQLERSLKRRAFVFVVSDFLSEDNWATPLARLAHRHDVVAVRVVDPAERELPNVGGLRLRDPGTGEEIWVDTSDKRLRAAHTALVKTREAKLSRAFKSSHVDTLELVTSHDIVRPLLRFALARRGRR